MRLVGNHPTENMSPKEVRDGGVVEGRGIVHELVF